MQIKYDMLCLQFAKNGVLSPKCIANNGSLTSKVSWHAIHLAIPSHAQTLSI